MSDNEARKREIESLLRGAIEKFASLEIKAGQALPAVQVGSALENAVARLNALQVREDAAA